MLCAARVSGDRVLGTAVSLIARLFVAAEDSVGINTFCIEHRSPGTAMEYCSATVVSKAYRT